MAVKTDEKPIVAAWYLAQGIGKFPMSDITLRRPSMTEDTQ